MDLVVVGAKHIEREAALELAEGQHRPRVGVVVARLRDGGERGTGRGVDPPYQRAHEALDMAAPMRAAGGQISTQGGVSISGSSHRAKAVASKQPPEAAGRHFGG
jgi:hypothetical protein